MNIRFITRLGKMPSRNVAVLALTIWAIGCGFNYAAFATEAGNDAVLTVVEKSLAERKEILKAMRDRLAELKPTENQDYDFAAFMQLYNEAMEKMAKVEAGYGADKQLKRLAKEHVRSAPKEQNQLQRWIEKFHQYD